LASSAASGRPRLQAGLQVHVQHLASDRLLPQQRHRGVMAGHWHARLPVIQQSLRDPGAPLEFFRTDATAAQRLRHELRQQAGNGLGVWCSSHASATGDINQEISVT